MLPERIRKEDERLEGAAEKAGNQLAELRWHWTLDESNPERVSIREYGRSVGRNEKTIRAHAKGYAAFIAGAGARTLAECIEQAKMGTETLAAAEAVAEARGIGIKQTRQSRPVEVRRVREIARQRAEDNQTSVEEEAPKVAAWIKKSEQAEARRHDERAAKTSLRFVEMEGHLVKAKRELLDALNVGRVIDWGDEEQELLSDTLQNVRALLNLIDVALTGAADVDWDKELANLTGEAV